MSRQGRIHFGLDRLKLRRTHIAAPNTVNGSHAIKGGPGLFQSLDSVGKGRSSFVSGDLVNLREILGHRGFECGLKVADLDLIKRWNAAIRPFPLSCKRIGESGFGCCARLVDVRVCHKNKK